MIFFPGVSNPQSASDVTRAMISIHRLGNAFQPPAEGWLLDSGGFSQLTRRGPYELGPKQYVRKVIALHRRVGNLRAAFQQDYAANEAVAEALSPYRWESRGTDRLAQRTRSRWLHTAEAKAELGCEVPIVPVLQGETLGDYTRHLQLIRHTLQTDVAGTPPIVGIGNLKAEGHGPAFLRDLMLCLRETASRPYRWHALGVGKKYLLDKSTGPTLRRELWGADSAAWSLAARYGDDWTTGDNADVENARRYRRAITREAPLFDR